MITCVKLPLAALLCSTKDPALKVAMSNASITLHLAQPTNWFSRQIRAVPYVEG